MISCWWSLVWKYESGKTAQILRKICTIFQIHRAESIATFYTFLAERSLYPINFHVFDPLALSRARSHLTFRLIIFLARVLSTLKFPVRQKVIPIDFECFALFPLYIGFLEFLMKNVRDFPNTYWHLAYCRTDNWQPFGMRRDGKYLCFTKSMRSFRIWNAHQCATMERSTQQELYSRNPLGKNIRKAAEERNYLFSNIRMHAAELCLKLTSFTASVSGWGRFVFCLK